MLESNGWYAWHPLAMGVTVHTVESTSTYSPLAIVQRTDACCAGVVRQCRSRRPGKALPMELPALKFEDTPSCPAPTVALSTTRRAFHAWKLHILLYH